MMRMGAWDGAVGAKKGKARLGRGGSSSARFDAQLDAAIDRLTDKAMADLPLGFWQLLA